MIFRLTGMALAGAMFLSWAGAARAEIIARVVLRPLS